MGGLIGHYEGQDRALAHCILVVRSVHMLSTSAAVVVRLTLMRASLPCASCTRSTKVASVSAAAPVLGAEVAAADEYYCYYGVVGPVLCYLFKERIWSGFGNEIDLNGDRPSSM